MRNYVKITPTRRRNTGFNISISNKIIRFSAPLTENYGGGKMFTEVDYVEEENRLYFSIDKEETFESFELHVSSTKSAYSFSSNKIVKLMRKYVDKNIVTAKYTVSFLHPNCFYIQLDQPSDATRTPYKKGEVNSHE